MSDEGCDGVKVKVGGGCCCVVLIASAIMVGCSFGVLDPTQFALDYDTVNFQIADGFFTPADDTSSAWATSSSSSRTLCRR